jgi:Esterase-like activity of phytase
MAISPNGRTLLPMLEKPLAGAPPGQTTIYAFDVRTHGYTGERWTYPYEPAGVSIGDFQLADAHHGLVIERDNTQGDLSGFKALEEVTLGASGTTVGKREAADLMRIKDPQRISLPAAPGDVGLGNPFAFPFQTIEDLVILDRRHVIVLNDNNFPFSVGRHAGNGAPDEEELIELRLAQRIAADSCGRPARRRGGPGGACYRRKAECVLRFASASSTSLRSRRARPAPTRCTTRSTSRASPTSWATTATGWPSTTAGRCSPGRARRSSSGRSPRQPSACASAAAA